MLLHRKNCLDQFQLEIENDNKTDVISLKTYQHIETLVKHNQLFQFSEYDYIICDEFHYFMSDAGFNKTTDMSLNAILSQNNHIRIFMSATGDYMEKYIINYKELETISYELPINFKFIEELTFYNKDSTLDAFIREAVETKKKAILFIQSVEKAYGLYSKYKEHCIFNCSRNNDKFYKYVDSEKIESILKNEKFDELILITTTCMDAGVNIKDKELLHIVCDVKDTGTLIQCIGRKRLEDEEDHLYLYIKTITNQELARTKTKLTKRLEMARFLRKNGVKEYIRKYQRDIDYSHIVYDETVEEKDKGTKKINDLIYMKCVIDSSEIDLIQEYGGFGYCKYIARKFGAYNEIGYTYRIIEEEDRNVELEKYLGDMVGNVMLQVKDRKELIEKVNVRDGNNNRLLKHIDTLNSKLREIGLDYIIEQFQTSRNVDGKKKNFKSAWRIRRLCDY
nr:helicase-related protein [Bacillus sp. SM2101]